MSALGQKQTFTPQKVMSALPPRGAPKKRIAFLGSKRSMDRTLGPIGSTLARVQ